MTISYLFSEKVQALVPLGLERPLERRLGVGGGGQRQSGRPLVALGGGRGGGGGVPLGVIGEARQLFVVDVAVLPLGHGVERERVGELHLSFLLLATVVLCGHTCADACRERGRDGGERESVCAREKKKKKR